MPPQTFDSDSEPEPVATKAEEMDEDVDDEEGAEVEEEYVVEAIKDHKFEGKVCLSTYLHSVHSNQTPHIPFHGLLHILCLHMEQSIEMYRPSGGAGWLIGFWRQLLPNN